MKMFLISDNVDTYTGMRLAGVEGRGTWRGGAAPRIRARRFRQRNRNRASHGKVRQGLSGGGAGGEGAPDSVICGNPGSAWNRAEQEFYN